MELNTNMLRDLEAHFWFITVIKKCELQIPEANFWTGLNLHWDMQMNKLINFNYYNPVN